MSTLAVICKAPVSGRVKTRMCPPCTPQQAAALAEAALWDTFDAVRATPCTRRVAVLDGEPGPWLGAGIDVIAQRGNVHEPAGSNGQWVLSRSHGSGW